MAYILVAICSTVLTSLYFIYGKPRQLLLGKQEPTIEEALAMEEVLVSWDTSNPIYKMAKAGGVCEIYSDKLHLITEHVSLGILTATRKWSGSMFYDVYWNREREYQYRRELITR